MEKNTKNTSNEFIRIIAPVDGSAASEKAAKKALYLAQQLDLPIIILYVIDTSSYSGLLTPDQIASLEENILRKEGVKILEKIKKQGLQKKINIQSLLIEGNPEDEIIKEANNDDLIVMGSKGKSAVDRIFIGSISERVLHHSTATVMIVR